MSIVKDHDDEYWSFFVNYEFKETKEYFMTYHQSIDVDFQI